MERPVDTTVSPCLLIQLFVSLSICYLLWFVAVEGKEIVGFIPLEHKKSEAIINNYYIKENNAEVLKALLEKVIDSTDEDKQLSSVTFIEHQKVFQELGFSVEKEWKRYVKMNKEK